MTLKVEDVKQRLENYNLELLSDYVSCKQNITVKCRCGNIFTRRANELIHGHTQTCGCGMYQYKCGNKNYKWKGYGEISSRQWYNFKSGGLKRGYKFDLTIKEAWGKYLEQDKLCVYTGTKLFFPIKTYSVGNASLDRIDPNIGYVKGNIQWVHKFVNDFKWDLGEKQFINYCELITNPLVSDVRSWDCDVILPHTKQWGGCGNLSGDFWFTIRSSKQNFNLTIDEAWNKYVDQGGKCSLTGLLLDIHSKVGICTASLNKIDNRKDYDSSNIRWIHKDINNKMRKYFCDQSLKYWCKKVVDYYG